VGTPSSPSHRARRAAAAPAEAGRSARGRPSRRPTMPATADSSTRRHGTAAAPRARRRRW
jgi:hypothetical protein